MYVLLDSQALIGSYAEINNIAIPFQGGVIILFLIADVFRGLDFLMILNKILGLEFGIEKNKSTFTMCFFRVSLDDISITFNPINNF